MTGPQGSEDFVMLHFAGEVDVGIYPLEHSSSRACAHSDRTHARKVACCGVAYLDWILRGLLVCLWAMNSCEAHILCSSLR